MKLTPIANFNSASVTSRTYLAGLPAHICFAGTCVCGGKTAEAAIIEPLPTVQPSHTTDPCPIKHSSPTRQEVSNAPCPIVTFLPITVFGGNAVLLSTTH